MNNYKEIYNEDIDRLAEGLREYLQEFNDIGYDVKYEALKIVMNNFKEAFLCQICSNKEDNDIDL